MALEQKIETLSTTARELLSEKKFTVKDAGISYRVLNHWSDIGLIEDMREGETGWRKISTSGLLWIRIIQELRKFGLSLEKLKKVRSSLFGDEWSEDVMEGAIEGCMAYMPMFIFVYETGMAEIDCVLGLEDLDAGYGYLNYVRVNLNILWYELAGDPAEPYFKRITDAQADKRSFQEEAEYSVLNLMRGEDDEISITRPRSRSGFQINASRRVEGVQKINEMLKELSFGDLHIHVENGKPVATKITKKTRIKK